MDNIQITNDRLDVNEIYSGVVANSIGAVSLFVGTTRDNFEGKKVTVKGFKTILYYYNNYPCEFSQQVIRLEYEAFSPMAEKELKKVCLGIRDKWKVENIAIYHR